MVNMTSMLRILPLGGLGEIGKNMTVFEYEDDIIIVDAGVMFPENDMLGVDLIIPDYHYLMEEGRLEKIRAIPVSYTHLRAHETVLDLVCRLLLEKKKVKKQKKTRYINTHII